MNKDKQKQLLTDIMNEDAKDGLYKQQTAVDWLVNQIFAKYGLYIYSDVIKQAKAMEKEQIENAYEKGAQESWDSEEYYKETYESNNRI